MGWTFIPASDQLLNTHGLCLIEILSRATECSRSLSIGKQINNFGKSFSPFGSGYSPDLSI
jgi:hypothetical protein